VTLCEMSKVLFVVVVAALALVASCNFNFFGASTARADDEPMFMSARPTYDAKQFVNKKVFITGGSSGIGYATALLFARFGADVVICARNSNASWFNGEDAVKKISADPIVQENKGKIRFYKADVADWNEASALFKKLENDEKWIMDYAFNNAGIVGAAGKLKDIQQYFGGVHDPVHNNLISTVNCLELEFDLWKRHNKNASVVNTASVNGFRGAGGAPLYPTSKFAIAGLTRDVGVEYARGTPTIRVNAIAPGFTNTSLVWQQAKLVTGSAPQVWMGEYVTPSSPTWQMVEPYFLKRCPTGKFAQPEDQANMVAFLLAEESALITGSIFVVDGGIGESNI